MAEEAYRRSLAVIHSADVADYGRIMQENEETFFRTLTTYRKTTIHPIQQHRNREADSPGGHIPDGVALQGTSTVLSGIRGELWHP